MFVLILIELIHNNTFKFNEPLNNEGQFIMVYNENNNFVEVSKLSSGYDILSSQAKLCSNQIFTCFEVKSEVMKNK